MRTAICDEYGIDIPVFAFSHSRAVVAAVSKAGGFGVLGAASMTPDELDRALHFIAKESDGKPFGVDFIIPEKYVGREQGGLDMQALQQLIPQGHRDFVETLLDTYHVPPLPDASRDGENIASRAGLGMAHKRAEQMADVALSHQVKLIVNALGVPPAHIIERAHRQGVRVGALVGAVKHAIKQKAAGVDLIVAQGFEAGGHTGEIATMVLAPQVVDVVAPTPVLCAGGIASGRQLAAALALGAQGAWTGSVWLMTQEAETHPVVKEKFINATSSDTLRSRSSTGKPARQLRSAWTDAWEDPNNPDPLPMPLHGTLVAQARRRIAIDATQGGEGGKQLINYFVGQSVGMFKEIRPAAEVLREMNDECDAVLRRIAPRG
ncbi:MAG TPA: nitronate monooxygenase family protein [Ktedonobacteraceae bacterium]|nr:nitronate monooxygenase family protein [Ktedonobacteraceae bacterium]